MRRGTTPTFTLTINNKGFEMSDIKKWYITLKQCYVEITKSNDDITIEDNVIKFTLKQQETLKFMSGEIDIEIRALTKDNVAIASDIKTITINRILLNEVIE